MTRHSSSSKLIKVLIYWPYITAIILNTYLLFRWFSSTPKSTKNFQRIWLYTGVGISIILRGLILIYAWWNTSFSWDHSTHMNVGPSKNINLLTPMFYMLLPYELMLPQNTFYERLSIISQRKNVHNFRYTLFAMKY